MSEIVHEAQTIEAKHIFIDIVEYTHERCVEAQSDLIDILNEIVKETITDLVKEEDKIIYSSTGDGMCITLVNVLDPYDIHMQIALLLLEKKEAHNQEEKRKMITFDIRIGINENTDNLIMDINGEEGVSGSGINDAARLEGLCDNNQILVGKSVHNKLEQRELYMGFFKEYFAVVKHGKSLPVYQYRDDSKSYLNNNIPKQFIKKKNNEEEIIISKLQAFYMINCINNKDFILSKVKVNLSTYVLIIVFLHLSEDEITKLKHNEMTQDPYLKIRDSYQDYYKRVEKCPIFVLSDLKYFLIDKNLVRINSYFEGDNYFFVNKKGEKALLNSYPDLCEEYNINI